VLIAENITKKFPGVIALDNVSLELHEGKVNAIIGENGAGKSTLMKILSGVYSEFEGRIIYKGKPIHFSNPKEAEKAGIAIIHQELNLIPDLTIAENIFLGRELTTSFGLLDKKKMRTATQQLLDKLKMDVPPDTIIASLKLGEQQVVEIAKALLTNAELIIMDEPTSAISESEVEILFTIINELKQENKTIVYISHKLDELFKIADRFIVLRDGKMIEQGDMQGITHDDIIKKMVGRNITAIDKQAISEGNKENLLRLENISLNHPSRNSGQILHHISFTLHRGEILGIFGLMGAGRTELLETIFGLRPTRMSGKLYIEQKERKIKSPADAVKTGIALVTEDRKKDGLIQGLDVKTNISITTLNELEELGVLSSKKETRLAKKYINELKIKTSSEKNLVRNLSGGNQQKIVLSKWLATNPKILLLDEPTRGIDINARYEIYKLMITLAEEGLGIIMVSSELPEILAVSDRVLVMAEGKLTAEIPIQEATETNILKSAISNN
jgi:ribose transport system ATP-binding protein